jgi:DtxR family Mn-dependent transcriptional regulator
MRDRIEGRGRRAGGPLSRSREDYLKALYALADSDATAANARLAERLGVSAPSVTNMLARLAEEGLVARAPGAGARLTARGRRAALAVVRRHRVLETFLVRVLGLDWSEVHGDAEVLEHAISDRVLAAIDRIMGHPSEDPHGHPIPDARGRIRARALRPLATLTDGGRATIREIRDADRLHLARWKELGLMPGVRVRVREVRALDGVVDLEIGRRRLTLAREGLEGVLVEAAPRAAR